MGSVAVVLTVTQMRWSAFQFALVLFVAASVNRAVALLVCLQTGWQRPFAFAGLRLARPFWPTALLHSLLLLLRLLLLLLLLLVGWDKI